MYRTVGVFLILSALLISCQNHSIPIDSNPSDSHQNTLYPFNKKDSSCGYMNRNGDVIIEPQYEWAFPFHDGLARVLRVHKTENKDVARITFDYINMKGEVIIETNSREVHNFSEGYLAMPRDGKWGYIDKSGEYVIEPVYVGAREFSEGLAAVTVAIKPKTPEGRDYKWKYINKKGTTIFETDFRRCGDFSNGLAAVQEDVEKGARYGYIDKFGTIVIEPQFYNTGRFSEGLAPVRILSNSKIHASYPRDWGYIDKSGAVVIPPQFEYGRVFSEGLAGVTVQIKRAKIPINKCGFIDKTGKFIIPAQFSNVWDFQGGLAQIQMNTDGSAELIKYIDKKGKIVWDPK